MRYWPRGFDSDIETYSCLVDTLGFEVVLDMLTMLLGGPLGVIDNPVGAPVIFQDLVVDEPQNPDGGLDMVRPDRRDNGRSLRSACAAATTMKGRRHLLSAPMITSGGASIDNFPRCFYGH